jgi:hypothetical protein
MAAIDQVLAHVNEALGLQRNTSTTTPTADSPEAAGPSVEVTLHQRRRGRFLQTADQSVLSFIEHRGNPSTAEINAHWRAEGRKGTANVTILRLLKQNAIRRESDPNVRGSRYVVQDQERGSPMIATHSG